MELEFERARLEDIDELLVLYRRAHGANYPIAMGTDPDVMAAEIGSPNTTWLVARQSGRIVASITGHIEPSDRMGKLQGLVVDPRSQGGGIANRAVSELSQLMLDSGRIDSVYGTARTVAVAPQRVCLRNGFHALGLIPNLFKHARQETMTLLAKYRDGVLEQRNAVHKVPASLGRLVEAVDRTVGMPVLPELVPENEFSPSGTSGSIELIDAPQFVLRHIEQSIADPVRRFYPMHRPNVMLADSAGEYQVYAHLNRHDGYCSLIGAAPSPLAVAPHLGKVIDKVNGLGAFHVETLVPLHSFDELCALLAFGFLPVAMYPGMRKDGDRYHDYVVLVHTPQPPDFRGLAIDEAFRPFTEQYIDLYTQKFLNTSGVFR